APPPALAAACRAAIQVMRDEPQRQSRVRNLAKTVREELQESWPIPRGDSPIIPLLVGEEQLALQLSQDLQAHGMIVHPIRPPTVPPAGSRLRLTVSSEHSD